MYPDKRHMTARSQGTEHNIVENQGNTHKNAACNVYSLSVQCVQIVHAMCTDRDLRCVQIVRAICTDLKQRSVALPFQGLLRGSSCSTHCIL